VEVFISLKSASNIRVRLINRNLKNINVYVVSGIFATFIYSKNKFENYKALPNEKNFIFNHLLFFGFIFHGTNQTHGQFHPGASA